MPPLPRSSSTVHDTTNRVSATPVPSPRNTSGPRILVAAALVLLAAWGVALLAGVGGLAHVLLLVGLMLLLMGGLKARDEAMRSALSAKSAE
jgi:hypothetical protein